MKGEVPWRGGREKDSKSMEILIEVLTTLLMLSLMLTHVQVGYFSRFYSFMKIIFGYVGGLYKKIDFIMFHSHVRLSRCLPPCVESVTQLMA